jgi:hypothetical protein
VQFADSIKCQLLKDWKRSKAYTLHYLNTMSANSYNYCPQESTRTFAQQMIHMAQGTISLMNAASGQKIPVLINRPNLENTVSANTKDSVSYFVTLSYDYAIEALTPLDLTKSGEYIVRGNFKET